MRNSNQIIFVNAFNLNSVQEYLKYAKFLDTKIKSVNKWAKDNNVSSEKIVNQVKFMSDGMTTKKNTSARLQSDIPQEWLDFEIYVADQGPGNQRCGEYDRCMKNKVGELLAGSAGAAIAVAFFGGPGGSGVAFLGTLIGGGFVVIYAGAWGECAGKREQCKDTHHPSVGPSVPYDGEEKLPCPNCPYIGGSGGSGIRPVPTPRR